MGTKTEAAGIFQATIGDPTFAQRGVMQDTVLGFCTSAGFALHRTRLTADTSLAGIAQASSFVYRASLPFIALTQRSLEDWRSVPRMVGGSQAVMRVESHPTGSAETKQLGDFIAERCVLTAQQR